MSCLRRPIPVLQRLQKGAGTGRQRHITDDVLFTLTLAPGLDAPMPDRVPIGADDTQGVKTFDRPQGVRDDAGCFGRARGTGQKLGVASTWGKIVAAMRRLDLGKVMGLPLWLRGRPTAAH